jgi:GTP cyclohydrolase I
MINQKSREIIENAIETILANLGEDVNREGLLDTPKRVAKMYGEVFSGYELNPKDILGTTFADDAHEELVMVGPIPFYSHCEHHMVPFFGQAWIGYIPEGKVVGISKFARLLDCYARRLQIQERLTDQVANMIQEVLHPKGVAVIIRAEHMCMSMRGVKKPGTRTTTSAMRGVFLKEPDARAEFLSLVQMNQ